jgi:hypothetical protein
MKLLDRLALIQKELKVPKAQFNKFGGYNFRNFEDICEAVKPLLVDCVLTFSDEVVMIGNRFYIKATAELTNAEQEIVRVHAYAREEEVKKGMDSSQISGAASSYARKYCANGLFLTDDTKDADTTNQGDKTEPKPTSQAKAVNTEKDVPEKIGEEFISDIEQATINGILTEKKIDVIKFLGFMEVETVDTIKKVDYQKAIQALKSAKGTK